MSYTIRLEDERSQLLAEVPGPTEAFNIAVTGLNPSAFPWLATLDPYGDSTFNRLQVPHLVYELRQLQAQVKDLGAQALIESVIQLAERAREEGPNRYLRFYGD